MENVGDNHKVPYGKCGNICKTASTGLLQDETTMSDGAWIRLRFI